MRRLPLRRLVYGPPPDPSRIFFHNIWFRGHNNARYAELLPRVYRLDAYLIRCSGRRVVRRAQMDALVAAARLRCAWIFALAGRRYRWMLYTGSCHEAVLAFPGRVLVDFDDPRFSDEEVRLLSSSNVAAYVVTAEWVASRFAGLGVEKPCVVIPQGVSLRSLSEAKIRRVGETWRTPDTFIVGYMASSLLSRGDRGGENPMYNVDHLLGLWDEIHLRVPAAKLWLVGGASKRVRDRCAAREDIVVFGSLPRDEVLAYVANFDVGLYPKTEDQGVPAAKVAEYMGAGVPTISYDFRVTEILRERGAGLLVRTPGEFVAAVVRLATHGSELRTLGEAARSAGQAFDWDTLAARYQREVLDVYLS